MSISKLKFDLILNFKYFGEGNGIKPERFYRYFLQFCLVGFPSHENLFVINSLAEFLLE